MKCSAFIYAFVSVYYFLELNLPNIDITYDRTLQIFQNDQLNLLFFFFRTTFTPIFTAGKMKAMLAFVQETCKQMLKEFDKNAETNESFELKEVLGRYSMDTIASCAFGVDAQAFTNKDSIFVKHASRIFENTATDGIKFFLLFLPFNIGTTFMRMLNISVFQKTEIEFFYEVILESLKARRESKTRRNDLIDMMLDAIKGDIEIEHNENHEQFEKV